MLDKSLRKDIKKRKLFKKVLKKKKKIAPRAKNKWELKKKSLIYFIYVAWWVSVEALRNVY